VIAYEIQIMAAACHGASMPGSGPLEDMKKGGGRRATPHVDNNKMAVQSIEKDTI